MRGAQQERGSVHITGAVDGLGHLALDPRVRVEAPSRKTER
jgi:hypothetical protein